MGNHRTPTMKTPVLPAVIYTAAVAAFALVPASAVAASIVLSVTGTLSIFAADYGRRAEPLRAPAPVVAIPRPHPAQAECRAAA